MTRSSCHLDGGRGGLGEWGRKEGRRPGRGGRRQGSEGAAVGVEEGEGRLSGGGWPWRKVIMQRWSVGFVGKNKCFKHKLVSHNSRNMMNQHKYNLNIKHHLPHILLTTNEQGYFTLI